MGRCSQTKVDGAGQHGTALTETGPPLRSHGIATGILSCRLARRPSRKVASSATRNVDSLDASLAVDTRRRVVFSYRGNRLALKAASGMHLVP